jgi:hypothetical protein
MFGRKKKNKLDRERYFYVPMGDWKIDNTIIKEEEEENKMILLEKDCGNCRMKGRTKEEGVLYRVECNARGGALLIFPANEACCQLFRPRELTQEEKMSDMRMEIDDLKKQLKRIKKC